MKIDIGGALLNLKLLHSVSPSGVSSHMAFPLRVLGMSFKTLKLIKKTNENILLPNVADSRDIRYI